MTPRPAFRLDPRIGWRTATADGLAATADGYRLAPLPGSAIPLADPAGSFGGAALPDHVAVAPDGSIFVIATDGRLLRYDICSERFAPLPCPAITRPVALAIDPNGDPLVIDGDSRQIVTIDAQTGGVRRRWGPFVVGADAQVRRVPPIIGFDPLTGAPNGQNAAPAGAWSPADIATLRDGRIAVSDTVAGVVLLFGRRGGHVATWRGDDEGTPLSAPTSIAALRDGGLAVVETGHAAIVLFDRSGAVRARTEQDALVHFAAPSPILSVDRDGTLWISSRLPGPATVGRCSCAGELLSPEPARLLPADCAMLAFDPDGAAILGTSGTPCLTRSTTIARVGSGTLTTQAIDSGVDATQWDRLHIGCSIPSGTTLTISSLTSDAPLSTAQVASMPAIHWKSCTLGQVDDERATLAIRSAPGRYIWVRAGFSGDGAASPVLGGITLVYPRLTSAQYLPATFSAEPTSADFLNRFLMLFDQMRSEMLDPVDRLAALFDPATTPAAEPGSHGADFLDWLAGWIGITLDRNWSVARRRRLVTEAPALYRIRGTTEGLKRHIEVYTGIAPKLVEHFRLRRWLALDETRLDADAKLWGPDIVRRLQLDAYSEIGSFALIDGGDPLTDPIGAFAHRATVYVPVGDDFSDQDRAALLDVVAAARPAHVAVDVRLMRPRFVIGCDLLLGVNTILGKNCAPAVADTAVLGTDIRLSGPPDGLTLRQGLRLGRDTRLD